MIAGFENTPDRIRDAASEIWESVLASVDPYKCVKDNLIEKNGLLYIAGREYAIRDIKRIFLAGVGKAVGPMARAVIEILQDRIVGGYLVGKHLDTDFINSLPGTISAINGSHPIPDMKSVESARGMVEFLKNTYDGDLVINLISGGGSALMTYPHNGISIEDMKKITEMLLESGADIIEINTIRKHLDRVKGGGLAREAYPARSESLILSDVLGDDVSMIASGPTAVDKTTYQDAVEILKRYGIYKNIPPAIQSHFRKGVAGEISETLKIRG